VSSCVRAGACKQRRASSVVRAVDDTLKWKSHVKSIGAKASRRLQFLKVLKRSSFSIGDLLGLYTSAVRPVLEYACPVWHNCLTNEQCQQIESIQRHALKIICGQNNTGYNEICSNLKLSSLVDCRSELCKAFFEKSVLDHKSCLHCMLPSRRLDSVHKHREHLSNVLKIPKTSRYYYPSFPLFLIITSHLVQRRS